MKGKAEMIGLSLQFNGRELAAFGQLARQFPKEMRSANGRAANTVKRKMIAAMKAGGGKDIPSFAPMSILSNDAFHRYAVGGRLSDPSGIVSFKRGNDQIIGWVDGLAPTAALFQKELGRDTEKHERYLIHRSGLSGISKQPSWYKRPARPVIAPLVHAVAPEYPKWVESAATKLIEKKLIKAMAK